MGRVAVHRIRREQRRLGEDGGLPLRVDLPDEVRGRVGDVCVALEIHRDVVGDLARPVAGGEGREEDTLARAEVVGGERAQVREWFHGLNSCEEAVVDRVDSEAKKGDVLREGGVGD